MAGVAVGDPFTPATLEAVADRLRRSGRFDSVEVLKRYASIADPTRISLVLLVNEGPVRLEWPDEDDPSAEPKVVRRGVLGNLMWLPILQFEDGQPGINSQHAARRGLAPGFGRACDYDVS